MRSINDAIQGIGILQTLIVWVDRLHIMILTGHLAELTWVKANVFSQLFHGRCFQLLHRLLFHFLATKFTDLLWRNLKWPKPKITGPGQWTCAYNEPWRETNKIGQKNNIICSIWKRTNGGPPVHCQGSYRQVHVKFKDFQKTFLLLSRTTNLWKLLIYTLKFYFWNARVHY